MTKLAENDNYVLYAEAGCDYNYIAYVKAPGFKQEVGRSWNMCNRVTKWFNKNEIRKAKSTLHAIRYVDKKFKA